MLLLLLLHCSVDEAVSVMDDLIATCDNSPTHQQRKGTFIRDKGAMGQCVHHRCLHLASPVPCCVSNKTCNTAAFHAYFPLPSVPQTAGVFYMNQQRFLEALPIELEAHKVQSHNLKSVSGLRYTCVCLCVWVWGWVCAT